MGKIRYSDVVSQQKSDLSSQTSRNMIYRKLSSPFTYLFLKLGLSPSAISLINLIPPLIGFLFLSYGTYVSLGIGILFFVLFKTLDCSDGEVARLLNPKSMEPKHKNIEGPYFDSVAHYVYPICLGMGIGIGLSQLYSLDVFVLVGVFISILFILEVAMVDLLKGAYRRAMINRNISGISDKEMLQRIMKEKFGDKSFANQSLFGRLFSFHPFQGYVYLTEFILLIFLVLIVIERYFMHSLPIATVYFVPVTPLTVYFLVIFLEKFIFVAGYLLKLKKHMYITTTINKMEK